MKRSLKLCLGEKSVYNIARGQTADMHQNNKNIANPEIIVLEIILQHIYIEN